MYRLQIANIVPIAGKQVNFADYTSQLGAAKVMLVSIAGTKTLKMPIFHPGPALVFRIFAAPKVH
jgi:hypothetical protein